MELETALLIIPPRPIQAFAYPFREEFDPDSFAKVPAHITLFYPFVPAGEVEAVAEQLANLASKRKPFEVVLDHFSSNQQGVYLEPADATELNELFDQLQHAFPDYGAPGPFHPHLTLARVASGSPLPDLGLPPDPSFAFLVDKLFIYVGSPQDRDAPYIPRATIPLGG